MEEDAGAGITILGGTGGTNEGSGMESAPSTAEPTGPAGLRMRGPAGPVDTEWDTSKVGSRENCTKDSSWKGVVDSGTDNENRTAGGDVSTTGTTDTWGWRARV